MLNDGWCHLPIFNKIKTETLLILLYIDIFYISDVFVTVITKDFLRIWGDCSHGNICRMLLDKTCLQENESNRIMRKWLNQRATTVLGLFMYLHNDSSWVLYSHSVKDFFPWFTRGHIFLNTDSQKCYFFKFVLFFLRNLLIDFKILGLWYLNL